jgi:hypothetical protein
MIDRLLQHIRINNFLAKVHFGFRPSASTYKASYILSVEILNALNNRMMYGGIFFVIYSNILIV